MTPNSINELIQGAQEHLDRFYHHIDPLKNNAEQILSYIEETKQPLQQVLNVADMFHKRLTEMEQVVREKQAELKKMDDEAAVLHRSLFHIREHAERQKPADYDPIVREVSSLLHLSLRLAIQMFPTDQLKNIAQQKSDYTIDMLRKRWQAWIVELSNYLKEVIPLISSVLDIGDKGILSEEYRQALEDLNHKLTQFVEKLKQETTPKMSRFSDKPLGYVQLLGKINKPPTGSEI